MNQSKMIAGLVAGAAVAISACADNVKSVYLRDHAPRKQQVVVSVIGGMKPAQFGNKLTGEEGFQRVIEVWKTKFSKVLPNRPDLIVMPEACDRYSQWSAEERPLQEKIRGDRFLNFVRSVAKENNCYIACSLKHQTADGKKYNSTFLIDRKGEIACRYDKVYPTVYEIRAGIVPGVDPLVFQTDFGRVGFVICYDLNFTDLLERYAALQPDLMVFSSAYHGGLMQGAWAYGCRSYFTASTINPECTMVNPLGDKIDASTNYFDFFTSTINLDYQVVHLDENWQKLEDLKAKYGPQVDIHDPGFVGAVLVSSRHPEITSAQMISEFKIELWDDYYRRSVETKNQATPKK